MLSSSRIDKYEYLTGEKVLSSDQHILIRQAKFTCSLLAEALEKRAQWKTK